MIEELGRLIFRRCELARFLFTHFYVALVQTLHIVVVIWVVTGTFRLYGVVVGEVDWHVAALRVISVHQNSRLLKFGACFWCVVELNKSEVVRAF